MYRTIALFAREGEGTLAPWDPTRKLVVRGPYRFVRNPMIVGVLTVVVRRGRRVRLAGAARRGRALFFAVNAVWFPLIEEPGLVRRFGAGLRGLSRGTCRGGCRAAPPGRLLRSPPRAWARMPGVENFEVFLAVLFVSVAGLNVLARWLDGPVSDPAGASAAWLLGAAAGDARDRAGPGRRPGRLPAAAPVLGRVLLRPPGAAQRTCAPISLLAIGLVLATMAWSP